MERRNKAVTLYKAILWLVPQPHQIGSEGQSLTDFTDSHCVAPEPEIPVTYQPQEERDEKVQNSRRQKVQIQ